MNITKNYTFSSEVPSLPRLADLPVVLDGVVFANGKQEAASLAIRRGYISQSAGKLALLFAEATMTIEQQPHMVQGFLEQQEPEGIMGTFYEFTDD